MFKITKREDVLTWMDTANKSAYTYKHKLWMKDLFEQDIDSITHFLVNRMCTTQEKDEYYGLLPYLKGILTPEVITLFDHRFTLDELLNELEYLSNRGIGLASHPLSIMRNSDKSYVLTPNGFISRKEPKSKIANKRSTRNR